ncbi:uncharacterized protein JCM6883_001077 [Sporobolomyces salmoneus]|uniref:uncharacterized protein n=1 Tax=Sporobolomyces salmoneus TaxID=183962 RepID=UPI00317DDAC3
MLRTSQPSSELDSFLSSIGASSLSTQLSTSTSAQASVIQTKIQQEIDLVNDSTLSLVQDKWETFTDQYSQGNRLISRLNSEEQELSSLELSLSDSTFLPPLISHLSTHQTLLAAHSLSTHTVTLLSSLLSLHESISLLSDSITSGQLYPLALEHLELSIQAVEKGAEEWIEETQVWKGLVKWQSDEQSRLETILQNTFESAFEFSLPHPSTSTSTSTDSTTTTSLTMNKRLKAAPNGPELSLFEVLKALDEVSQLTGTGKQSSKVEGLLARVSKQVLRSFIAPFLESNGTVEWENEAEETSWSNKKEKLVFSYPESTSEGVHKVILGSTNSQEEEEEVNSDPIEELSRFLQFFTTHSSLFSSPDPTTSRYTSYFTASLTPSLQSYLITSHLVPSLPSSTTHLTSYLSLLSRSTSFESTFLPSLNLFAFLPPSSSSSQNSTTEESHILSTWARSLPQHYARALGEKALARVRNQVKNWDWANPNGGEMVEVQVREEEEMEGLLRGLELGLLNEDEDESQGKGNGNGRVNEEKDGRRRRELETVPKGAKREMTLEEALAPRPARIVTPPPPSVLQREPTPPSLRLSTPPAQSTTTGRKNKMKLGASKITKNDNVPFLPPSSPSPPPMFQGDDNNLSLPTPSITSPQPPSPRDPSTALPPISTSTSFVQLDPLASQQQHNRSSSRSSSAGAGGHGGTPILSPRPISIPSSASFTHAVEHSDEEQVHSIVERAQRTIAEEGEKVFDTLEEVNTDHEPEMVVGERELEREIEVKMELEEEEEREEGEGGMLTREALERANSIEEEDRKPFLNIKREEEEDDDTEALSASAAAESTVEYGDEQQPEIKQEVQEESLQVKEEELSKELETTPQVGDYEPTPQPPRPPHGPEFYSQTNYEPPRFYSQDDYTPTQFDSTPQQTSNVEDGYRVDDYTPREEPEEETRFDPRENYEPEIQQSLPPPVPQTSVVETSPYEPPRTDVLPPPRSNPAIPPPPLRSNPSPIAPPPRTETFPVAPPPPRVSPAFAPPPPRTRSQGVLSPPVPVVQPLQNNSRPVSPAARSSMPIPPPPRPRQTTAPSRSSPVLHPSVSFERSTQAAVSPVPVAPPKSASPLNVPPPPPPPPRGSAVVRPPPLAPNIPPVQARVSPSSSYPRQSTVPPPSQSVPVPAPITSPFAFGLPSSSSSSSRSTVSPRPPSRTQNQDGPILNHIQQRFVSPPPTHLNPYSSLSFPTLVPSTNQQTAATQSSSSYIPANDPIFADLFGSSSGGATSTKPAAAKAAAYFAPDPPGRQQRSNSTSSQGSNYRPSSRGSQRQTYQSQPPQQQYSNNPMQYYQPQSNQGQGQWEQGDEVEELEDRYAYAGPGGGGYGQAQSQQEAMRLRGGGGGTLDFSDSSDEEDENDSSEEEEEESHVVMRLRGGATLDLGEMDEDEGEGNKSGDDWGFGDGIDEEEGGDEDAWGFGGEDDDEEAEAEPEIPPTPSPPPVSRNPPPPPPPSTIVKPIPVTSPVRSTFSPPPPTLTSPMKPTPSSYTPTSSHLPSASISSVTSSQGSSSLTRPPSYSFSSTLAPLINTRKDLGPATEEEEEEEEEGEEEAGEDAWGFNEELETESPPPVETEPPRPLEDEITESSQVEIPRPVTPLAAVEPEGPSPPPTRVVHQVVLESSDVLPPISIDSKAPQVDVAQLESMAESSSPTEEVDEWGFGVEVEESPKLPTGFAAPTNELVEPVEPVEPVASQEVEVVSHETHPEPKLESPAPENVAEEEEENVSTAPTETPIIPSNSLDIETGSEKLPIERKEEVETTKSESAEGPIVVNSVESQPLTEIDPTHPVEEPLPGETPALDNAEEGHFEEEESGWGLDEAEPQPEITQDESPPLPTATPALDVAEEGHSVVESESDGWDLEESTHEESAFVQPSTEETIPESEDRASTPTQVDAVSESLATATPALDHAEFGIAPTLSEETTSLDPELETEEEEEVLPPVSTPALELAEEGQQNEFEAQDEDEISTQLTDPVPQASELEEPVTTVEAVEELSTDLVSETPEGRDLSADSTTELPNDVEAPTQEETSPELVDIASQLPEEKSESTETRLDESALTAPAEELQEQPFPTEQPSNVDETLPSSPTPTLPQPQPQPQPQPLPHHDQPESEHVAHTQLEEALESSATAEIDDAALLDLEGGEGGDDDPWGIEGEEGEAVEGGLTSQEAFIPDERASEREEHDLPVEETLFDSSPLHEPLESTDIDHSRRSSSEGEEDLSPPQSDTVLVEPMSASNSSGGTHGERNMSSPEVIERSDAWGYDLEEEANGAQGAEILESQPEEEKEREEESTVQHELERPISHEESTVQHLEERPVVESTSEQDLMASNAQPQQHTFSPPPESLPEPTAEPATWNEPISEEVAESSTPVEQPVTQEIVPQSESPSPAAALSPPPIPPTEDDTTVDDPWDLDLEEPAEPEEESIPRIEETELQIQQPVDEVEETPLPIEPQTVEPAQESQLEPESSSWNSLDVEETPQPQTVESIPVEPESTAPTVDQEAIEQPQEVETIEEPQEVATEEEEGWGWDETADQEQELPIEPETQAQDPSEVLEIQQEEEPKEEEQGNLVTPLVEAAGVVSSVALGTAAALGLTTDESSPSKERSVEPQEPAQPSIETSSNAPASAPEPSQAHDRKESNASADAEGWGWDGEGEDDERSKQEPEPEATKEIVEEERVVSPVEPVPSAPPARMEKMMVSRRSREIVKIAEEILVEALTVASPSFEHPQFSAASAPLLSTFVSLLSLYRATAAVHNSTVLSSVPAIGMQFANDADWIGREVERVWKSKTEGQDLSISTHQATEVEAAIESTRQLGRDTRQKQIAIQRAALMESLDEAGGFLRTSDDSRYATCERALQQVTHTLQRLALVWKPVMTPTALYTTLGGLVNEVLLRVLDEIEDQTDISEEESIRLNRLCKMLHELESLFDGSSTSVGREVPIWFKFVFLSELLEASMADILFLFDHGHLVDFSPQEIVRLIRALFSDSPLRNRNVEKILAGHPTVTPQEEEDEWAQF